MTVQDEDKARYLETIKAKAIEDRARMLREADAHISALDAEINQIMDGATK